MQRTQRVVIALMCSAAEETQRRSLLYLHQHGIEGRIVEVQRTPCIEFNVPQDWSEGQLDRLRNGLLQHIQN